MDYTQYVKDQISEKDWEELQKMDITLDTGILAQLWLDFIDFEKRKGPETEFLGRVLSECANYPDIRVLDTTLGSGATTLGLVLEKIIGEKNIVSNEIDTDLTEIAQGEAKKRGIALNLTSYDWRDLDKYHKTFDAVLCLGNSLTYLFKREDQLKALENFRNLLKPDGKLIIDERNYAEHFLKGPYRFSGEVVYCGIDKVQAHPVFISENMVVMEYYHMVKGIKAHLVLYPFKTGELKLLLIETGLKDITVYGNYMINIDPKVSDILTYVGKI